MNALQKLYLFELLLTIVVNEELQIPLVRSHNYLLVYYLATLDDRVTPPLLLASLALWTVHAYWRAGVSLLTLWSFHQLSQLATLGTV